MNRKCRICGNQKFNPVIDFGQNPLVNSLIKEKDLDKTEPTFSLIVEQCQNCSLVQIVDPIDSDKIYKEVDYLYFTGEMPSVKKYFEDYARELVERFLEPKDFVLEIGSNDGTMLVNFRKAFYALGVDPAQNVVVRALKNKIPTVSAGFTKQLASSILREYKKAKLIYANNCIAHIDNLKDVMEGIELLLDDKGVFAVECNYWGAMVRDRNYSLIYHDHFSYFTATDWCRFAEMFGMKAFDATVTPAQGGSLRIFMSKDKNREVTNNLLSLLSEEVSDKLFDNATSLSYAADCQIEAQKLYNLVAGLKAEGKTIAGYGAAAKGFSVLKLAGIGQGQIDYFVDDSPAKQGKYTPVSHIPVISRKEADNKLPDYFFITAPNYKGVIIEKESEFQKNGGRFITTKSEII